MIVNNLLNTFRFRSTIMVANLVYYLAVELNINDAGFPMAII
jgi:hypothetical protein